MLFFNPEHQPFAIALIALAVIISILIGDAFFIILAMVFLGVATAQGKHLIIKISIGALLTAVVLYYLFLVIRACLPFVFAMKNEKKSHVFQGKNVGCEFSIRQVFDDEKQDLAIFHAKTFFYFRHISKF
ncbi:hypothetical protein LP123_11615 [Moraxella bovis]|uniref:Uncharacterized protein n=1 Tax=Moraxella bovis TaxID=476 RepID=A0AAQ2T261_MORBO|nr:hypothetical protein [Moraxella bovis]AWY19531.1 hypothetical protein DQF64_02755 [Moraxella bovis]UYZ76258.1 hypothetical protein LP093_02745 [Moraxella bovis]UYZ77790.1 hypothetical protein LP115_11060 [Moraxella bovis]UYZ80685.1 hypothetical protein LP113_11745 [Moraxella bovis]UYZ86276.1 hypothetical protein LP094_11110 [Moraxella bovis]